MLILTMVVEDFFAGFQAASVAAFIHQPSVELQHRQRVFKRTDAPFEAGDCRLVDGYECARFPFAAAFRVVTAGGAVLVSRVGVWLPAPTAVAWLFPLRRFPRPVRLSLCQVFRLDVVDFPALLCFYGCLRDVSKCAPILIRHSSFADSHRQRQARTRALCVLVSVFPRQGGQN